MDLYAENVLDHYRHPRNHVLPAEPSVTHRDVNMSCGDAVEVGLVIDGGQITIAGWVGEGCAVSQAGMSMLSEELQGKTPEEIEAFTAADALSLLGVPVGARRMKCALLGLHAVKNAVRKAGGKEPQSWVETVGANED